MSNQVEGVEAVDASSAVVAKQASIVEALKAGGTYTVRHWGPVHEEDRERTAKLYERIAEIEARSVIGRALKYVRLRELREELESIPMEEKSPEDTIENVVTNLGGALLLDTLLSGSAYSVTGPFMGLISATPTCIAGNTMSTHAGWTEVGNANVPKYTAPRKTITFAAASGKSKASTGTYTFAIITTGGTVGGVFLVLGTGAVSTIDDTNGTLYSCGAFSAGDKAVGVGDSLTVTYTATC